MVDSQTRPQVVPPMRAVRTDIVFQSRAAHDVTPLICPPCSQKSALFFFKTDIRRMPPLTTANVAGIGDFLKRIACFIAPRRASRRQERPSRRKTTRRSSPAVSSGCVVRTVPFAVVQAGVPRSLGAPEPQRSRLALD